MTRILEERNPPSEAFFTKIANGLNPFSFFFLVFLFFALTYYLLGWPISGEFDTDLWYHLNGGRYLFSHGKVPDSGFFSFIAGERQWVNYYWGFQATVYSVFSFWGYSGLIVLRTALYIFAMWQISSFFLRNLKEEGVQIYFTLFVALLSVALLPRYFNAVRPHVFSYLFIVLFLCIFESRKLKLLYLLPLLSIFWVNLHGVEYPVMMLICFAYLGEVFVERFKSRTPLSRETLLFVLPILLALYAVFANPFGSGLFFSPFKAAPYQYLYIAEMKKPELATFFIFDFTSAESTFGALSNLLILIGFMSCIIGLATRKMRLSHIILFIGGMYLLSQAHRFRYEAILLALPLVRQHPPLSTKSQHYKFPLFAKLSGAVILLIVATGFLNNMFRPRPHYPISYADVPIGISAYLNHVKSGGKLLNNPNHGGFFQWQLGDRYKVYMDMEMMLFTDEDFFRGASAFLNRAALGRMIEVHRPDFLAPPIWNTQFKNIIKEFPDYKPVFFDDTAVLYVDSKKHPEIAAQYNLNALQPSVLVHMQTVALSEETASAMFEELQKMQDIYPGGMLINKLQAQIAREQKDYDRALRHTELLISNFPENQVGFQLQGDIFFDEQLFDQSLSSYKKALLLADEPESIALYKKISACFLQKARPGEAYLFLKKTIDVFSERTSIEDYYNLGRMALEAGEAREGVMYLGFALHKVPAENRELIVTIKGLMLQAALQEQRASEQ